MKAKYIYKDKNRKRAFLGAVIGAVGGVVSSLISANKQKKAAEEQLRQQTIQNNISQANALAQTANNTSYIDNYKKRITFKHGGKHNNVTNNTNIDRIQRFKIGGRKRGKC